MITLQVNYFDGQSAASVSAELCLEANGDCQLLAHQLQYNFHWSDAELSPELAKTARRLQLPNGGQCEITDLAALHAMEAQQQDKQKTKGLLYWVNRMESRWHYVVLTAIVVISMSAGMIIYGLPALSKYIALALPVSIDQQLSEGTDALLESDLFKTSEIPLKRQQRIAIAFTDIINQLDDEHSFSLVFRRGLGANAFAFPSGVIVVTDGLLNLAESDAEVHAVLLHEMGHVVNRHGLRLLLQGSVATLLLTTITGDFSVSAGFIAALPMMLLKKGYSRDLEREADDFVLTYLESHEMSAKPFIDILQRMSSGHEEAGSIWQYSSSHPATDERVRRLQQRR